MTPDTSFRPGPPPLNLQQAKRGRGGILLGLSIAGLFLPMLAAISFFLSRADLQAIARGEIEEGERPATHTSLVVASVGCGLWGVAMILAMASMGLIGILAATAVMMVGITWWAMSQSA